MRNRAKRRSFRESVREANGNEHLSYRMLSVRASSIDEEARSIEIQLTTETPVPMPDWERYEMVPEVLLTKGADFPKQVPLLDSHDRSTTESQLGSIRNIVKGDGGIEARAFFSSVAKDQWTKVREGHVTDVSAGYKVIDKTYVPRNTTQIVEGRSYRGPVNVVTKWKLREGSITPIGADEQAKMRGLSEREAARLLKGGSKMNEALRAYLEGLGMPKDFNDEQAAEWATKNTGKRADENPKGESKPNPGENANRDANFDPTKIERAAIEAAERAAQKIVEDREQKRAAHRREVDALCELADTPELRSECYEISDLSKVREKIQARKAEKKASFDVSGGVRLELGAAQLEKHRSAVGTALSLRALENAGASTATIDKLFPVDKRAKDAGQFEHCRLLDMARECLHMDGINTRGLSANQIAMAALGFAHQAGVRAEGGYHVTASFPKLTLDASNKSLQAGYAEAPSTWEGPMRRGSSVPDFKTINRIRLGTTPNLPIWIDNKNVDQVSLLDAKESYNVEAYAEGISFSWKLLVNDDMDALSRVPQQLGNAARRTVNAYAWAVVTSNPTMSDGQALFSAATGNRKRANLATGAATPTVSTVGAMKKLMRLMRGENTPEQNEADDVLNLMPKYLIGPAALETTIEQLVNSIADPAASGNAGIYNPTRTLTPVIEPLLDASSATAFYLFASPSQIDTIEVTFLQGQETPYTWASVDEKNLSQCLNVMQSFGCKALNHRGVQKHAGA